MSNQVPPAPERCPSSERTPSDGSILPDLRAAAPRQTDGLFREMPDCTVSAEAGGEATRARRQGANPSARCAGPIEQRGATACRRSPILTINNERRRTATALRDNHGGY